jgi:hypothetical protein
MPRKPRAKKQKLGDCYEAAFKFIMDECIANPENEKRYILIHAEVMGQGDLEGTTFGHAFVMKDGAVVAEHYVTQQPEDRHIMFSVSKSVTAALAGRARAKRSRMFTTFIARSVLNGPSRTKPALG